METKVGLTAEQVEELVKWIEKSWTTLECRSSEKIINKIRELQQPKKRYVEVGEVYALLRTINRAGITIDEYVEEIKRKSKTLEEFQKDGE